MPAPSNTTSGTAIDAGTTLPYNVTQQVDDAGTTYEVWYKRTAQVGEKWLGLWGFGPLADPYKPRTRVYSDAGITLILDTGTSFQNRPVQFPVTPGTTYYFRFTSNAGNPTPANLVLNIKLGPDQTVPLGSIAVNDDTEGFPLVFVSAIDGDDYNVLGIVDSGFPAGEAGDVLPTGEALVSDSWNGVTKLFDGDYVLIDTLALNTDFGFGVIRACHGLNKFYVAVDPGGATPVEVYMVDELGNIDATSYTLTGKTNVKAIAANNDGTILYFWQYQSSPNIAIQRWDLTLDIAMSNLVADDPAYDSSDLLYLDDDTILALLFPVTFSGDVLVRRYDTSGTLLDTYNIGPIGYPAFTFPRLAQALDNPDSFWIMFHDPVASPTTTIFRNILISDGSTAAEVVHIHYETGTFRQAETATPISRFGVSFSCPFWITHSGTPPVVTGTITVGKLTDPYDPLHEFTIDVGPSLTPAQIVLQDAESQDYTVTPGSGFTVVEQPDPDWSPNYLISNDPTGDNLNITVAAGEHVTVIVLNVFRSGGSGPFEVTPGKPNDDFLSQAGVLSEVAIPSPLFITGFLGDR